MYVSIYIYRDFSLECSKDPYHAKTSDPIAPLKNLGKTNNRA